MVLVEQTELEMCDLPHCANWRCVLVPGYGFGWVQQADVVEIKVWILDKAPLTSSLRELVLAGVSPGEEATLSLNSGIGASLEKLSLDKAYPSGDVLKQVMLRCRNLKAFYIGGPGGEMLTRGSLERVFSLRQLTGVSHGQLEAVQRAGSHRHSHALDREESCEAT